MKNKIVFFLQWLTVSLMILVTTVSSYWLLRPYSPIVFKNTPFKVLTPIVKSGGYLTYEVEYCKYSYIIPTTSKTFVDGIVYTIPETIALKKEIGCGKLTNQIYVPKALPKGVYVLETAYKYKVNPLRTIIITVKTEKFVVE